MNLQDVFLNQVRKEKIPVTVTLTSGEKVTGVVKGFDQFAIFIRHDRDELVYKHAIVTIVPLRPVNPFREEEFRNSVKVERET